MFFFIFSSELIMKFFQFLSNAMFLKNNLSPNKGICFTVKLTIKWGVFSFQFQSSYFFFLFQDTHWSISSKETYRVSVQQL